MCVCVAFYFCNCLQLSDSNPVKELKLDVSTKIILVTTFNPTNINIVCVCVCVCEGVCVSYSFSIYSGCWLLQTALRGDSIKALPPSSREMLKTWR